MIIQIKVGTMENFAYIIWDESTRDAAVIDPGWEVNKILEKIKSLGLRTRYILLTHAHFDHASDVRELKRHTNAKILVNEKEKAGFGDQMIKDGDIIKLGKKEIEIIETPGHTQGGVCFIFDRENIFTGDTLFTNGSYGRTDLPGGNEKDLGKSIKKILSLPGKMKLYPGHDYSNKPTSTIKEEKQYYNL
ncbi:MAG TPA: MBL fold metallo-hydrolase [Candidatus Paceibacterota bacterium]|nr:MBL fold metallo-hydrolase [Candidatus Paceibacterota bacterium]